MKAKTLVLLGLLTVCTLTAIPTATADITIIADYDNDGDCEPKTIPAPDRGIFYVHPCHPGGD